MKRSIFSALLIGSAATFLFRRSRQNRTLMERILGGTGRGGWMRNMQLNAAFSGILSRVMGRKMVRRFSR